MGIFKRIKEKKELERTREIWLQTLVNSRCLIDMLGHGKKTFDLLEMKTINNGIQAISLVPYGLSVDKLNDKKIELEDALNALVTIEKDRYKPQIWIRIINKEPKFKFEFVKTKSDEIWLGYKHDGIPFTTSLDDDPHFIFGGGTGSGKTYAIACILTNLFLNNTNKKGKPTAKFYLSQIAKADLKLFESVPHVAAVLTKLEDITDRLKKLLKLGEKRNKQMTDVGVTSISKWNELYGKTDFIERIFFVVDELAFFMPNEGDDASTTVMKKECWSLFRQLAYSGRSSGISILGIVQRACAGCLGGDGAFKSQLSRFSLKQKSGDESRYIIDTDEAYRLKKREAVFKGAIDGIIVVPTLQNGFSDLKKFIKEIKVPEDYIKSNEMDFVKEDIQTQLPLKTTHNDTQELIKLDKLDIINYTENEIEHARRSGLSLKHIRENKLAKQEIEVKGITLQERDKKMIKFIESYGAITINQTNKIFYDANKKDACRKRLKKLSDAGAIQFADIKGSKEKQYYLENQKPKKLHELYVIDCYCKLIELGANIIKFKTAHRLLEGKILPDAYIQYSYKGKAYKSYIEVDYTHYTSQTKIGYYENYMQESKQKFNIIIAKEDALKVKSKTIQLVHTDLNYSDLVIN